MRHNFRRLGIGALLAFSSLLPLRGAPLLAENFNSVSGLTGADWVIVNNSSAVGSTTWFQGNTSIFEAQSGPANSYAAANFNAATFGGNISLFLITPVINYVGDVTVSFWTRKEAGASEFQDNLQLLLNNSNTTDAGATDTSTGDFALSLYSSPSSYPEDWTLVSANATLTGPSRMAFRYSVTDTSLNGSYIGIDTFSVDAAVPEPATYVISSLGLLALAILRRRA